MYIHGSEDDPAYVVIHKTRSVGPTTCTLPTLQEQIEQHAKGWLRARGEPLTRANIRAIAEQARIAVTAMASVTVPVENEKLSAGNRKQRRAAYARGRRAGA